MKKNMSSMILEEVSKSNKNTYSTSRKVLREQDEYIETETTEEDFPYDDTTEKFCPRCGRTYTEYPAVSRYDNKTYICPDCGVEEAMINYTGGKLINPNVVKKDINEEVNIDNPSAEEIEKDNENIDAAKKKEIEDKIGELNSALADGSIAEDEKKAIEDEIKELESMLESAPLKESDEKFFTVEKNNEYTQEDENSAINVYNYYVFNPYGDGDGYIEVNEFNDGVFEIEEAHDADIINNGELANCLDNLHKSYNSKEELENDINEAFRKYVYSNFSINESAKVLTEAPEDEEFELVDDTEELPIDEPIEEPIEDEEMTDAEVDEEIEEDKEDTIEDAVEEPFYATTAEYDELRDILVDLDYRLFLINDNMVCIGRLNGPDIEFLTSNRPAENTEVEVSEQNDNAEEIEERAEEDGENSYEYLWIKAPDTMEKFLNQVNVVYLSPEMSDEDKEQYAGIEASHESVMNFLMNELPEDKREEHENEEAEEEIPEEIPMEEPIEPIENIEEPIEEEIPEEDEEEEE